jgi:hypothetical protein
LEYQGNYGTARGNLDVSDLVNNPEANGLCRVHGVRVPEEGHDLSLGEVRSLLKDGADSLLVRVQRIQLLAQPLRTDEVERCLDFGGFSSLTLCPACAAPLWKEAVAVALYRRRLSEEP